MFAASAETMSLTLAVITPDADRDEADGKAVEHGDGFSEKDDVVVHCFRQVKPAGGEPLEKR
jgi:hypothetical protein